MTNQEANLLLCQAEPLIKTLESSYCSDAKIEIIKAGQDVTFRISSFFSEFEKHYPITKEDL